MDGGLQLYWYIASGASFIFIIQSVMTLVGISTDIREDSSFQLYALRNIVNFFVGFGWTGVALYSVIHNMILLRIIACIVGVGLVVVLFLAMRAFIRLKEKQNQ